jgi:hypothetical protein
MIHTSKGPASLLWASSYKKKIGMPCVFGYWDCSACWPGAEPGEEAGGGPRPFEK